MTEKKQPAKVLTSALLKAGAIIGFALLSKYVFGTELGNDVLAYLSGLF